MHSAISLLKKAGSCYIGQDCGVSQVSSLQLSIEAGCCVGPGPRTALRRRARTADAGGIRLVKQNLG